MEITSYFENHKSIIEAHLSKAKHEALIAVAWINFKEYFEIFDELLDNNVSLKIICSDNPQNRAHQTEIQSLKMKGAEIRLLQMPYTKNHMHHKFAILDNSTIINGSFNWSPNATKSFENLVVIKNCPNEVAKFYEEFNKILKIETSTIKTVQKKVRCQYCNDCDGEMLNMLVFSEYSTKYFETYGDIVSFCNSCYDFEPIVECFQNTSLCMLLNEFPLAKDDYEYEYLNNLIFEELNQYINESAIHAVGKVKSGLDFDDEDYVNTKVIWKNKFVGDRIPDEIENTDFNVLYDNH